MKKITAFVLALTAVLNFTACSENANSASVKGGDISDNSDVSVMDTLNPGSDDKNNIKEIEVTSDNMINSIRIFDELSRDKERSMFSPLSLNMALGLIETGAGGTSKTALDAYLATENYSDFAAEYIKTARENYNREEEYISDYKNVFEIGNSLWADKDKPFKEEYKNGLSEKFDAETESVDFSKKSKTIKAINNWCSDKTHKMITEIIKDYDENITSAILINTLYFESGWVDLWNYDAENKEPFTLADGTTKDIPFIYNRLNTYFENDKATAFGSYYRNGLEFIGILPKNKGDFDIETLDIPSLLESCSSYEYYVDAKMPRLNFESEFQLKDVLSSAGMADIFDPNKADFSGISDSPFFVSDALQKTNLELDEKGTRAAAATGFIMATGSMNIERENREVSLDRPFAFLIYDSYENQIVFIGKVNVPE